MQKKFRKFAGNKFIAYIYSENRDEFVEGNSRVQVPNRSRGEGTILSPHG
jgi:hypothetical protein